MPRGVKNVTKEVKEEIKEEVVEEIKEEVAAEPVAESEEVAAAEPAEETKEEIKEEVNEVEGDTAPAETPVVDATEVPEDDGIKLVDDDWKYVENLRIYPRSNDLACSTVFTGNIKVVDDLGDLKRIQYMKHGFGIVEALTDAL